MPSGVSIFALARNSFEVRWSDAALLDGRLHGFLARREIQVDRNHAGHRDTDVRQRAADRRRQQHADHFAFAVISARPVAPTGCAVERAAEGQLAAARIGHRELRQFFRAWRMNRRCSVSPVDLALLNRHQLPSSRIA